MKWTKSEIKYLEQNQHLTAKELAVKLKRSHHAVREKVVRLGLNFKREEIGISKIEEQRCFEMFENGISIAETAIALGRTDTVISCSYSRWIVSKKKKTEEQLLPVIEVKKQYWEREEQLIESFNPKYLPHQLSGPELEIFTNL